MAARLPTRRRGKGRKTSGSGSASFPFPVLAGVTCKKQKKRTQQSISLCFLFFRSVSVFSFSDLLHRRSFFGFTSSSPSLQVGVLLVWDGVCGGGAGGGRRCCTESGPSLLVEEGGQLWRMRKGRRLWALLRLTEGSLSGVGGAAASESWGVQQKGKRIEAVLWPAERGNKKLKGKGWGKTADFGFFWPRGRPRNGGGLPWLLWFRLLKISENEGMLSGWEGAAVFGWGRKKWRWAAVERQVGSGFQRMSGQGGRRADFKWRGVLGSLVLGEQKPRTPGDGGCLGE